MQIAAQSSDEEELYAPMSAAPGGQDSARGAAGADATDAQVTSFTVLSL